DFHSKNSDMLDNFAAFPSNHLSLVRKDGSLDLYHGVLRAVDSEGKKILNDVDYQDYLQHIGEEVKDWSYMKFPYLKSLGKRDGWYTVGPLARLNTCDFIDTPLAQKEFEAYKAYTNGKPSNASMHMHWARLIETLHAAEKMKDLLNDPDLQGDDRVAKGTKTNEGVGLLEAPRGTLFHHYRINDNDQIEMANLIVSTTNNNEPMNRAVNFVAKQQINGQSEVTEGMLNAVEVAIRAYDPCLSCATHALGKMPLELSLVDADGNVIDQIRK
ncbi:MAG TPA: nickel-dependent hydrogenase large subunit, partial [Spirochaetota bacterium]|nr:nickel-dependent hydrogenase large subunit [Spirochaetota bacterium]